MERLARDKHSSLLYLLISSKENKCCEYDPGSIILAPRIFLSSLIFASKAGFPEKLTIDKRSSLFRTAGSDDEIKNVS
jgi:hypothetical protein